MYKPAPRDYDTTPERYRLGTRIARQYASVSLYARVADRLTDLGADLILDVGCADGALRAALPGPRLIGLDAAMSLLRAHPAPAVCADATKLPFPDNTFDAVTALNMLYHLPEPAVALREAHRVLKPGGHLVSSMLSRRDSPEFNAYRTRPPTPYDAEEAPDIVAGVFGSAEVDAWDGPFVTLPSSESIRDYLVARRVPAVDAERAARELPVPLTVTKRGALVSGRKIA